MIIKELDHTNKDDVELVNDYWIKLNEKDKVQGRYAVDCSYFNYNSLNLPNFIFFTISI